MTGLVANDADDPGLEINLEHRRLYSYRDDLTKILGKTKSPKNSKCASLKNVLA